MPAFNYAAMNFIQDCTTRLREYKTLAEKAMAQISDDTLLQPPAREGDNSLVVLVKHMHGNMLSRWTNFLTEDGEKPWRERHDEFRHESVSRAHLMQLWEEGWACFLDALAALDDASLSQTVHIRSQPLSAGDAILRQVMHYSYHVGQIILLCKQARAEAWQSLSIPQGGSAAFNAEMRG
jgi:hypothetical protein